jgi:pimeloyl-ACP methyl ester carboxylesterase
MPTTTINGVGIFWELGGERGDPVVLVHGSWGDHRNWAQVLPELSRSFKVLAYDRRGHSQSERPDGQGSIREDVADLAALLEHLGHWPAHIVGSSFGGSIVLRLATERPELFRSLTVHEPPLFDLLENEPAEAGALAGVKDRMARVAELLAEGDLLGGARLFAESVAFGPGAWQGLPPGVRDTFVFNAPTWLDEVRDPEAFAVDLDRLRAFTVPALLTVGGQSPPPFPAVVEPIARVLLQARRRTFADAGHVPHVSHPQEYVHAVGGFMLDP